MKKYIEKVINKISKDAFKNMKLISKSISKLDIHDVMDIGCSNIDCMKKLRFLYAAVEVEKDVKNIFDDNCAEELLACILNVDFINYECKIPTIDEYDKIKQLYDTLQQIKRCKDNLKLFIPTSSVMKNDDGNYVHKSVMELLEYYVEKKLKKIVFPFNIVGLYSGNRLLLSFENFISCIYLENFEQLADKILNLNNEEAKNFINTFFDNGVDYFDKNGSFLHYCEKFYKGEIQELVDKFLELGVKPNRRDERGYTYFHCAIEHEYDIGKDRWFLDDEGFRKSLESAIRTGFDMDCKPSILTTLLDKNLISEKVLQVLYDCGYDFSSTDVSLEDIIKGKNNKNEDIFEKVETLYSCSSMIGRIVRKLDKNDKGFYLEKNFFKYLSLTHDEIRDVVDTINYNNPVYGSSSEFIDVWYESIIKNKENSVNLNKEITIQDMINALQNINDDIYASMNEQIKDCSKKILIIQKEN